MSSFVNTLFTTFTIITGSLSCFGSSLLICMILRSKKKLSVPYRRLIFGTSVYDVFQSLGLATSIFLSPEDTASWAKGNTVTCDIQGFFTTIGAIGVPIYLCSLCTYYFCIIRLNMKKSTFKKIEPFLHAAPILYSFFCGIAALANQYFNNAGSVCYVAPKPITCEIFPDQECTRGEGASRFRLRFLTLPSMVIFVIVCIIMAIITFYAKKIEKRQRSYSYSFRRTQRLEVSETSLDSGIEDTPQQKSFGSKIQNAITYLRTPPKSLPNNNGVNRRESSSQTSSPSFVHSSSMHSVSNRRRRNQRSKDRMAEIKKQALLYIGSYILSYGFVWTSSLLSLTTKKPPLMWLRGLSSIFFPLQGFINVFIYCRPHVVSLRALSPGEYTWFQAFIDVLKSGGDDPKTVQQRRSNSVQRLQSTQNPASRSLSAKSLMEMESDSSSNGLIEMDGVSYGEGGSIAVASDKRASATLPIDIENQSGDTNNEDIDLVDSVPESLENMIQSAEKTLELSLKEFRNLAVEGEEKQKRDLDDDIEDSTCSVSDIVSPTDSTEEEMASATDEEIAVDTIDQEKDDGPGLDDVTK